MIRTLLLRAPHSSLAAGDRRRAAIGGFLERIFDSQSGLMQRHYVATGLLAIFIVIAFFGIMLHVNRMVFGTREDEGTAAGQTFQSENTEHHLPFSCRLALIMAAVPVLVFGFYIPKPLQDLLTLPPPR